MKNKEKKTSIDIAESLLSDYYNGNLPEQIETHKVIAFVAYIIDMCLEAVGQLKNKE